MASIGSLTADLRLESAAFRRDLGRATAAMNSQTAQMRRSMRAVERQSRALGRSFGQLRSAAGALVGALAVRQFARFAEGAVNAADAIAKQSKQLQFGAGELQRWTVEANLAGVSTQKLGSGIGQLTKRIGEARAGTGSLAEFLKRSNKELLNQVGAARSSEEAFKLILTAIKNTGSAFEKQALSAAAFGRSAGQAMVVLADSSGAVSDEMAKLVTRSSAVLKAAEQLQDQMTLLRAAFKTGFDSAIIEGFAGSIDGSVESMREANKIGAELGRVVGASLRGMIEAAKFVANNIRGITAALAAFVAYKAAAIFAGIAVAAWKLTSALIAATAAQRGLNIAMIANPIGAVATAIGLAVGALVMFHDKTFKVGDATVQVGKVMHATWVSMLAPLNFVSQGLGNIGRALAQIAHGDFAEALNQLKGGGDSGFDKVLAAWRDLAPDAAKAAKDLADGVDEYTYKLGEAGAAAAGALSNGVKAGTKTIYDHIEAVQNDIMQTRVLIEAVKRGEQAYVGTRREIDAINEAHKLGIDLKSREGNAWADLTVKAAKLNDELKQQVDMLAEAGRIYDQTRTPLELFNKELELLNTLVAKGSDNGGIGWDTYSRAVKQAQDRLGEATEATKKANDAAQDLGMTFASAFEDAIVGGKKLKDVLKGLHQDIIRIAVRKSITEPLAGMVSGLFSGGGLSSLFPGREFGGPVTAGDPYIVGEAGPELFVPSQSGDIVPMGSESAQLSVVNNFSIHAPSGSVSRETQQQIAAKVGIEVSRAMERIR